MTTDTIIDVLLASRPAFHGHCTHSLVPEALRLIEQTVGARQRTLETGAGLSTVAFAASGAMHTTIVKSQVEVDRISAYCKQHAIPLGNVTFVTDWTEQALPALELGELDLVLLDGSHAFPGLFIEWFYTADALKTGGRLIVDDVHLWTGRTLRDFLRASEGWEQADELRGRTAIFDKTESARLHLDWSEQPYVHDRSLRLRGVPIKIRQAASMLRHRQPQALLDEARASLRRARG